MTSRSMIAGVVLNLAAGALLASALPASAADTITGEIVDMACYVAHPATGRTWCEISSPKQTAWPPSEI